MALPEPRGGKGALRTPLRADSCRPRGTRLGIAAAEDVRPRPEHDYGRINLDKAVAGVAG
jgi:hypothetical protein